MKITKKFIALSIATLMCCNAYAEEESMATKIGSSVREAIGGFKDGFVKTGEERDLLKVELANTPNLTDLAINSAKESGFLEVGLNNGITCYIVSKTPFNGKLVAKAYDKNGTELGYSEQIVFLDENRGKEIVFDFPRTLKANLVEKYVIDYQESGISIDVSPNIESELGLRFIKLDVPSNNTLTVYAIANKELNSRLVAKAFDKDGNEVNRDAQTIWFADNTAKEITFDFKDISKVTRYSIEIAEKVAKPIEMTDSIKAAGLSITRSTENTDYDNKFSVTSYVIANDDFTGRLIAKAFDSNNSEIGRGIVDVKLVEDDAQELIFNFPQGMNVDSVVKITLEAKAKK